MPPKNNMKKLSLATRIFLGMLIGTGFGTLLGCFLPEYFAYNVLIKNIFHIGGTMFLNMFRMIVIPVVLVSLIRGITGMNNPVMVGRIGGKTLFIFGITTVFSAFLGILGAYIIGLGKNSDIQLPPPQEAVEQTQSLSEMLTAIIPTNPFTSFVTGNMLQIIFLAIILGIAISMLAKEDGILLKLLEEVDHVNIKIVKITLSIAPYGVFCLMAETFLNFGIKALFPLFAYILTVVSIMLIVVLGMYSFMLKFFARLSPWTFFVKFKEVMLFAFSSSSSNATLPVNIDITTRRLGVNNGLCTFILSLGATINMNGTAIMQGCSAVFLANLYGITLTIPQMCNIIVVCLISSVGTAGMPGAGILMLGLVLQSVGIPIEGTAIILGIDRIVDMFRTTVNITGDTVTAILVADSEKQLDRNIFHQSQE